MSNKYEIIAIILLTIASLTFCSKAESGDIYLHLASYHPFTRTIPNSAPTQQYINGKWIATGKATAWNETNPGVGYSKGIYEVGVYHNSEYNVSGYVSVKGWHKATNKIEYGVKFGLVSGYTVMPIAPVALMYGEYRRVRVTFIPALSQASIGLSYRL